MMTEAASKYTGAICAAAPSPFINIPPGVFITCDAEPAATNRGATVATSE
jgi:hypothetical protein